MITVKTEIHQHKHGNPKVYTREIHKDYSVVHAKRRVLNDLTTVPCGYRE